MHTTLNQLLWVYEINIFAASSINLREKPSTFTITGQTATAGAPEYYWNNTEGCYECINFAMALHIGIWPSWNGAERGIATKSLSHPMSAQPSSLAQTEHAVWKRKFSGYKTYSKRVLRKPTRRKTNVLKRHAISPSWKRCQTPWVGTNLCRALYEANLETSVMLWI